MKLLLATAGLSLLPGLALAKDLGLFYGEPTPAYALYVAQVNAAAAHCGSAGLIRDEKRSARFTRHFNNATERDRYRKKDESFAANYDMFTANYSTAWEGAAQQARERFCAAYNDDVDAKEAKGLFKFGPQVLYFRNTFSPKTPESLARARKWAGALSLTSAVLTSTATISAGRDSVAAAKAGDWATSNQLMSASRDFNAAGSAFVSAANAAANVPEGTPLWSVLDAVDANGTRSVIRCPVLDHFFSYAAPIESPLWTKYMSIHLPCREPLPADLGPSIP